MIVESRPLKRKGAAAAGFKEAIKQSAVSQTGLADS
jgi:hypothetical protein